MQPTLNRYFALWAFLLPVTSFLIVPTVPGTTPGLMMGLASVPFVLFLFLAPQYRSRSYLAEKGFFFRDLFGFCLLFGGLTAAAQLSLALAVDGGASISFEKLTLVSNEDWRTYLFRSSMFTQSLYLFAAVALAVFVKNFYRPSWNRYIVYGALVLCLYGIYEFVYFLLFHANGDFVTNRVFKGGSDNNPLTGSGSLFQTMNFFGIDMMRIKSLTGEPSMYSFTVLPLWIYAVHLRKTFIHLLLLASLLLTFSTTAFIGILLYLALRVVFFKLRDRYLLSALVVFLFASPFALEYLQPIYDAVLGDKSETDSGLLRQTLMERHLDFFGQLPLFNQLFGVGFGYVRSADLWSTFLCNVGIVGVALFTLLFLLPILKLKNDYENVGIKSALIVIYATSMIAVSEFSYLTIWLFVGMAYARMRMAENRLPAAVRPDRRTRIGKRVPAGHGG